MNVNTVQILYEIVDRYGVSTGAEFTDKEMAEQMAYDLNCLYDNEAFEAVPITYPNIVYH